MDNKWLLMNLLDARQARGALNEKLYRLKSYTEGGELADSTLICHFLPPSLVEIIL